MLKKLLSVWAVVVSAALVSCGGGDTLTGGGSGGNANVASIQVLAASTSLDSDQSGLSTVDITAIVRDANNVVLADVPVLFGANANGSVSVINLNTDANGQALARLSNGNDASNRTITVSASAGSAANTVNVNVVKTAVTVDCPDTAALGTNAVCSVLLKDSKGTGISGQTVAIVSSLGNTLSSSSVQTNGSGAAPFTLTAINSGTDTLTVSALGDSGIDSIIIPAVTGDSFSITTPAANGLEIPLNTNQAVTVAWLISGTPQNAQTMQFAASRGSFFLPGTLTPATSADTAGGGTATLDVRSSTSGLSTIAVTRPGGGIATRTVEFVAVVAASLDVQAEPSSVRTGNQSQITAIVRDPAGNLVKNKTVNFSLSDNTGGSLSSPVATTGSDGRAIIAYTAGSSQSALNGVTITGTVQQGASTITDVVALTVTGQALAISLGTGNALFELGTATFAKEWVIFVTDADGNAVAGKPVIVSIRSVNFKKGNLYVPSGGKAWVKAPEPVSYEPLTCPDEDSNFNGILDLGLGEDTNNSGLLEAGNIALVAPVAAAASAGTPCADLASTPANQANITTANDGRARVCVLYPQNYNLWLDARIQARASVQGTEFSKSATFELEALADDINNVNASPPGVVSPFGDVDTSASAAPTACAQPPPP